MSLATMHEWALAEAVCTSAMNAAQQEHLDTIIEIVINIGELQQINKNLFQEIMQDMIPETYPILKKAKITVHIETTTLHCRHCNHEWTFTSVKDNLTGDEAEAIHFVPEVAFVHMRCPKCQHPDFEIIKGRGVSIQSITGEKADGSP